MSSFNDEMQAALLYSTLARTEKDPLKRQLFEQLGVEARKQAEIWRPKGSTDVSPTLRTRFVNLLIQTLGPRAILPVLAAMKVRGVSIYTQRVLSHEMPHTLEDVGRRHQRLNRGGNLRAAVFGANDGLVSNASLILGVAGASAASGGDGHALLTAGVSGLLAGALSMAAGEYISVRSQRELYEQQITLEKEELEKYPEEEAQELALIYQARGLGAEEAKRLANTMIQDPVKGLDTLAREELGIDPQSLDSEWGAAISSFLSFAVGAAVPLAPLLIGAQPVLLWTGVLAGLGLFGTGIATSLFTGKNAILGGIRMLSIGAAAGLTTYAIGLWLGG